MSTNTISSLVLTIPLPLTEHPACVYLSSLAPGSLPTMKRSLSLIAQLLTNGEADYLTLNWANLRYKHTAAIRAALIKNYEPATVNRILCALRRVLKEALRLELISPVDYARAVDITSVKSSKELRGRALSQHEIDSLMKVCFSDRTPAGFRDAALIAILRGAGLRRAEVVKLDLKDFNSDSVGAASRREAVASHRAIALHLKNARSGCVTVSVRPTLPGLTQLAHLFKNCHIELIGSFGLLMMKNQTLTRNSFVS